MRDLLFSQNVDNFIIENIQDSMILKCFVSFLFPNYIIADNEISNIIASINNYKNVASLGYLLSKNLKAKEKIRESFKQGIVRISGRELNSFSELVNDDIAIFGIILGVKSLNISDFDAWINKVIELRNQTPNESKHFVEIISKFVHNEKIIYTNGIPEKQIALLLWLKSFSNEFDELIDIQQQFFINIWKKGLPIFQDFFYDILAISVADTILKTKFRNGIITIENKYSNAICRINRFSKILSALVSISTILIIFCGFLLLLYYVLFINPKSWSTVIGPIFSIFGLTGFLGGIAIIFKFKKINNFLQPKINKKILSIIGLY